MTIAGLRRVRDFLSVILAMTKEKGLEDIQTSITEDWNSQTHKGDTKITIIIPGK